MSAYALIPFLAGVLLGSIPFAWLVVRRVHGVDVSREGSGNVGALNSMRVTRSRWIGVVTLLLDVLKGVAAGLVGLHLGPELGLAAPSAFGAAAIGVMAGHVYNPWLSIARGQLSGGKGFAALAGAALVHVPWLVPVWLAALFGAWALIHSRWKIKDEAPASLVAILVTPPAALWIYGPPEALTLGVCCLLVLPRLVPEVRALLSRGGDEDPG